MTYDDINDFFDKYTVKPIYGFDGFYSLQKKLELEILIDLTNERNINANKISMNIEYISGCFNFSSFKFNVLLHEKDVISSSEEIKELKTNIYLIFI